MQKAYEFWCRFVLIKQHHNTNSWRETEKSTILSLFQPCLYCYFNKNIRSPLCKPTGLSMYISIPLKITWILLLLLKRPWIFLPLERRSCTSKRVSVISLHSPLDYTSWAHQTHHNYSNFALIYSNAVSYLWGNYEHFFLQGESFCVDKGDRALKEICCCKRKKEKKKRKSKIGELPFRHCCLRLSPGYV